MMIVMGGAFPMYAGMDLDSASDVSGLFSAPSGEYTTAPFWVWNDEMTDDAITRALEDYAQRNIRQVFVHPRPGLMTPYLSEEWFRLWKHALAEAERLGILLWIYDENSYPSGFAGGEVPEAMPESRGQGIDVKSVSQTPKWDENILAVYAKSSVADKPLSNITEKVRAGDALPEGEYYVVSLRYAGTSQWFAGKYYVDLLRKGVTEKFLEVTVEAYRKRFGSEFGKRIPGVFTDEPHLAPAGGLHWTPDLPEVFQNRWGYSLLDNLPLLVAELGDWKRVRHNYFQILLDLFIERWAKPYFEYCATYNLEFTGHYWEHEWPKAVMAPDNMAMAAWQQRPGIDILFNQPFSEDPHAQVGNVRAALEISSVANQLGRRRTLCEAFGGGGWDMRLEDMKRIGDWLQVFGVNTINEHLSWTTLRGARKTDYPPTFSYHSPWWDAYPVLETHFTRLSAALSHGAPSAQVLVIEPTTTAWMYQVSGGEHLNTLGKEFHRLLMALARAQVEFDLGSEKVISEHGAVENAQFVVGKQRYSTVLLPPFVENLNATTVDLLAKFLREGGKVISCGECRLDRVDGVQTTQLQDLRSSDGFKNLSLEDAIAQLSAASADDFRIEYSATSEDLLFHQRRHFKEGDLVFLVNSHPSRSVEGVLYAKAGGAQRWDTETGEIMTCPFDRGEDGTIRMPFQLSPAGSLLVFLTKERLDAVPAASAERVAVEPTGNLKIQPLQPNVLTLDYLDLEIKGNKLQNSYYWPASHKVFHEHGLFGNPWDHSVQFRDEFIQMTFPEDSGFKATYRFTIEGDIPKSLEVAIERTDIYDIYCNGVFLTEEPHEWFIDRETGRLDIRRMARVGENEIVLEAHPFMVWHEIQPIYILGDFSLKPTEKGFVIVPPTPLGLGPWNQQGYPLYGHAVEYAQEFQVENVSGKYIVALPEKWYGSVATVKVNEKEAGTIYHRPFECDVTSFVKRGKNTISVTVLGTLKNTLGPHHNSPPLGIAGPDMFRRAPESGLPPGNEYHTVGYGLFETFRLWNEK